MASSLNLSTLLDTWFLPHSWIPDPQTDAFIPSSNPAAAVPEPQRRSDIPPTGGKVSKRKSRASKRRNHTTFIAADPANFRHMVQQVTGGSGGTLTTVPVLKADPQRPPERFPVHTSAFFQHGSGSGSEISGSGFEYPNNASIGSHFDTLFSSFPTLESWKAVV